MLKSAVHAYAVSSGSGGRAATTMLEIPEDRVIDIDTLRDFCLAELMLRDGMIRFPWLGS